MHETTQKLPLIIAHRGASAVAPENTVAAFEQAIADGADGLEFDVRLAKDGVPVVIHDSTLDRTARLAEAVADMTSKQLASIDVGSWFPASLLKSGGSIVRQTVPLLTEVLSLSQRVQGPIFIELKCSDAEVDPLSYAVCEAVKQSPVLDRVIIKSFRLAVISRTKALMPTVRTAALFAPRIMTILRKEKHMVTLARELGADELSVHFSLATRKLCDRASTHGMPVNVWTTNNSRWIKRALRLGIRSLITDDPTKLLSRRSTLLS
ncbi:MAG TPA: glycerophosphodiester phosphodiesterase family protein [Pyrinomonadaceae bacterium]|nr:glycerophosphodiester phosphodiesterase family protein [Pyrinomonadaceae bacterium]